MELHKRGGYYFIKENNCVNKRVEGRTDKQYREDKKEWEKERHKRYNGANEEKQNKKTKWTKILSGKNESYIVKRTEIDFLNVITSLRTSQDTNNDKKQTIW